jgi:hypothetical protein
MIIGTKDANLLVTGFFIVHSAFNVPVSSIALFDITEIPLTMIVYLCCRSVRAVATIRVRVYRSIVNWIYSRSTAGAVSIIRA